MLQYQGRGIEASVGTATGTTGKSRSTGTIGTGTGTGMSVRILPELNTVLYHYQYGTGTVVGV